MSLTFSTHYSITNVTEIQRKPILVTRIEKNQNFHEINGKAICFSILGLEILFLHFNNINIF